MDSNQDFQRYIQHISRAFNIASVAMTNLYCIPTYLIWMWVILLPFRLINHPGYWYLEKVLYKWLLTVVSAWSWKSEYHIVEVGDDISSLVDDKCVFIVNHQSTADVPLLMQAFQEKENVLESIMWIMDRMFRWTNFGAVSMTHGDYFITQGKQVRDNQMRKLQNHLLSDYIGRNRRWIILFPEGGFLSNRKESSNKYAQKNNFPILDFVTLPRIGAFQLILETLRPGGKLKDLIDEGVNLIQGTEEECMQPLKYVIDITIAYPEADNPLDLLAICSKNRPPCSTYMYYRCYPVDQVPSTDENTLRDWMYDRWVEKEYILGKYYQTGIFPQPSEEELSTLQRQPSSKSTESSDCGGCEKGHPVIVSESSEKGVEGEKHCLKSEHPEDVGEDLKNGHPKDVLNGFGGELADDALEYSEDFSLKNGHPEAGDSEKGHPEAGDSVKVHPEDNVSACTSGGCSFSCETKCNGEDVNCTKDVNKSRGDVPSTQSSEFTNKVTENRIHNGLNEEGEENTELSNTSSVATNSPTKVSQSASKNASFYRHSVQMSYCQITLIHAFFISSSLFQCYLLCKICNCRFL